MTVKIVVPTWGSLPVTRPPSALRRSERRADDARLAGKLRRAQLRRRAQERGELSEALAHRAAQDEHVGPEEPVHLREVRVDALHPGRKVRSEERRVGKECA